ncbi:MAG: hypothetical protein LBH20_01305 [Treponema sp.]|jgi:hypothetical protein|nr:hypothetical protein [Treponema sp.]
MYKPVFLWLIYLSIFAIPAAAESFRSLLEGTIELSADNPEGSSINLAYNSSALISLGSGSRFFRGIELELSAPQAWLAQRGSLAMLIYAELDHLPSPGTNDLEGRRIAFDALPNKIKIIYQIPVRRSHGLKTTPYVSVPVDTTLPASFPLLFKLMPIIKGLSEEVEKMQFTISARPILADEGAVRLNFRYPEQLRDKPFIVLIDDVVLKNITEEQILKEGEHRLLVLSDDYRNENRRFMVERAKRLDIAVNLQDPTPLIIFEAPGNAHIFLNNNPVARENGPLQVEPGVYEAKFQVGDYTITKSITVQRGKTYRIALAVGIDIEENE